MTARMPHAYTPGLRVTEATVLRKERRLPLPGEVHVEQGQPVTAGDLVASTELPGNVTSVNVAHELNLQPQEVAAAMVKALLTLSCPLTSAKSTS